MDLLRTEEREKTLEYFLVIKELMKMLEKSFHYTPHRATYNNNKTKNMHGEREAN